MLKLVFYATWRGEIVSANTWHLFSCPKRFHLVLLAQDIKVRSFNINSKRTPCRLFIYSLIFVQQYYTAGISNTKKGARFFSVCTSPAFHHHQMAFPLFILYYTQLTRCEINSQYGQFSPALFTPPDVSDVEQNNFFPVVSIADGVLVWIIELWNDCIFMQIGLSSPECTDENRSWLKRRDSACSQSHSTHLKLCKQIDLCNDYQDVHKKLVYSSTHTHTHMASTAE